MAEGATTPRDRFREQTRGEIKAIALRQLSEGGIGAIALTRIAKELGLSGPALYRYYAGRDELISELVRDAYDDLAAAVSAPAEPDSPPRARLLRLGRAYRAWAREQPHRYLLIFGSPLPGYAAPPDTVANARAALETADYGYVLETGEIVQQGKADTLIHDPKLIAAYLGGGEGH